MIRMVSRAAEKYFCFLLCSLFIFLVCFTDAAVASNSEKVRVGWFYQPGYMETRADGSPYGYNYEYLQYIAKYTGWEYEFINGGLEELYKKLLSGDIDLLGCIFSDEMREREAAFPSHSAGQAYLSMYTRADSPLAAEDYASFNGLKVAVSSAANTRKFLRFCRDYSFSVSIVQCRTVAEIDEKLKHGEVDAAVTGGFRPRDGTKIIARFSPIPFYFITTKGNDHILSQLNRAMNAIMISDPYFNSNLSKRYTPKEYERLVLTKDEMEYVKKSGVLKVSYSLQRGPFEFRDENGKFSGIVADLFAQISELTGLKFEYRPTGSVGGISGDADILSSFQEDFDTARRMGFRLTSPYLRVPMVIVRKALADSGSKNMKTALPRYYYSYKNISGCSVVFYDDARSCLEAVKNGEVEQALLNSVYVEFMKQKSRYRNLWTSSTHDVNFEPCIAVRSTEDPRLLEILMKAVDNISPSEMNEILMNNVMENQKINLTSVIDSMPVDIVVFFSAFLLVMVIILLLLVRNRSIYAAKIRKMLDTDELTGVLSFVGFERMAKKILLQSDGSGKYFIVEFDVSRFRSYNALYGAKRGYGLLKAIASASVAALPKNSEIFARVYSDNFAVLLSSASVDDLKKRIIAFDSKLKSTVIPDMSVMLNYGIYEITDRSLSVREMVDCATMAKKTVKGNAEDIMGVYDCSLSKRQNEESSMISSMDSALKNREFVAFYQPKYDSVTREIVGAEALVRWRRPDGSLIMPDAFIGLFERNGQIIKLDHYMFETICAKQKQLIEQGAAALPIAVNFSKAHLYDRGFAECLSETADKAGIPKSLLEIEFTETAVTDETENALCSIRELKRAGFVLAMDDFGSGYSSLNTLKDLPFDVLKLDRGFLQMSSESGDRGRKIICGVIGMSKELSFKTVAEGVETEEQYDFLRDCGCDVIQGYYFSRPVDDDTYAAMLMEQSRKM